MMPALYCAALLLPAIAGTAGALHSDSDQRAISFTDYNYPETKRTLQQWLLGDVSLTCNDVCGRANMFCTSYSERRMRDASASPENMMEVLGPLRHAKFCGAEHNTRPAGSDARDDFSAVPYYDDDLLGCRLGDGERWFPTCSGQHDLARRICLCEMRCESSVQVRSHDAVEAGAIAPETFVGCFADQVGIEVRDLAFFAGSGKSKEACRLACSGYKYFGRQGNGECFCDNVYGKYGVSDDCNCEGHNIGENVNCVYVVDSQESRDCVPSACLENGERDSDCCGAPGTTTCDEGYHHFIMSSSNADLPVGFSQCAAGITCCEPDLNYWLRVRNEEYHDPGRSDAEASLLDRATTTTTRWQPRPPTRDPTDDVVWAHLAQAGNIQLHSGIASAPTPPFMRREQ